MCSNALAYMNRNVSEMSRLYLCTLDVCKDKQVLLSLSNYASFSWMCLGCIWRQSYVTKLLESITRERALRGGKAPERQWAQDDENSCPRTRSEFIIQSFGVCQRQRQGSHAASAGRTWSHLNERWTAITWCYRLSYHSPISLLKVTWKQEEEQRRGNATLPNRRGEKIESDEWENRWGRLKSRIYLCGHQPIMTAAQEITIVRLTKDFKRKFAYNIWTSAYLQNWHRWLGGWAVRLQAYRSIRCKIALCFSSGEEEGGNRILISTICTTGLVSAPFL